MSKNFLTELRHRKVIKTTLGYAVFVAAVVEFTSMMIPVFSLPEGLMRGMIIYGLIGLPVVMVLAWFFDLTASGVILGGASSETTVKPRNHSHFVSIVLITLLATTVIYLSYRLYWENNEKMDFARGKSIAVMPFTSISADNNSDAAYFSRGVSEEILNALSKVKGLRVAARTSTFSLNNKDVKQVGELLNVSVILQGSVRREKEQLRISVQLIDTNDGFQVWSDTYNHKVDDVFKIQEKIALAIVDSLQIKLLNHNESNLISPGTESMQAYEKYLEGRDLLQVKTAAKAEQAIEVFQQALNIDPNYAQAYAGLADSWILLREVGNIPLFKATQYSHDAITKSLQLNNLLPEAQASLGLCVLGGESFDDAARQFQKAIDLDPNYSNGYLLRANLLRDQGNLTQANQAYTQAIALDPLNSNILENQALLFAYQGRFVQAIEQLDKAVKTSPNRLNSSLYLSKVYALAGNNQEALRHVQNAQKLEPLSPIVLALLLDSYVRLNDKISAESVYEDIRTFAENNETAIASIQNYYLFTGDNRKLDEITEKRVSSMINNEGFKGTQLLFKRAGWKARALLAQGDFIRAHEILAKGIPDIIDIFPQSESIQILVLLIRAKYLSGDIEGANESSIAVIKLLNRAQTEGMSTVQLAYIRSCVAAATNQNTLALSHLKDAIKLGWSNFTSIDKDPIMSDFVLFDKYQNLMNLSSAPIPKNTIQQR